MQRISDIRLQTYLTKCVIERVTSDSILTVHLSRISVAKKLKQVCDLFVMIAVDSDVGMAAKIFPF